MPTKLLIFLFLLLAAAWLSSCHNKEANKIIIQGHVTEYGTDAPIQGARIYLWCSNGEIFGSNGTSFIDSLVTDVEGAFHIEYLDRELCGGVYLSAFKEGFFYKSDIDIHSGVNDLEVMLDPEAWLRILTAPDGQTNYDHIGVGGDFSFETSAFEGTKEHVYITRGNRDKIVGWGPFNDPSINFIDTIYVLGGDTVSHVIHY